jgi:DNA-binding SARP family transcriptional activator
MGTIKIHLLGTFRLYREHPDQKISLIPNVQTLLAYLLVQPGRFFRRDGIAGMLWGERTEAQARCCLNTALWRLRRALEGGDLSRGAFLICRPNGEIGFNWESDYWLDVQEFETEAYRVLSDSPEHLSEKSARTLQNILLLYNGDLLETFSGDWAIGERERMRSLFLRCLAHQMMYCKTNGDYEQALICGERILKIDLLREEIHRELMEIYVLAGRRPLAIRQYEICRSALLNELGILPMPQTRHLHSQILAEEAKLNPLDIQQAMDGIQSALNNLEETRRDMQNLYALFQRMNSDL